LAVKNERRGSFFDWLSLQNSSLDKGSPAKKDARKDESDGDQMDPVKVTLNIEKNRDGRMRRTQVYFDYQRSRVITQEGN